MIEIRLKSDLARMERGLAAQQTRVLRAISQGLNEGGDKVRTQVRAAMREQTGLMKLRSVTSRERVIRAYATGLAPKSGVGPVRGASLDYVIVYGGRATRPKEFKLSLKTGKGGGVSADFWGVSHKFARSFVGKGKIADALKARKGRDRFPLRGFFGPNLAKEAVKGRVAQTFVREAGLLVIPMIEKRLARVL